MIAGKNLSGPFLSLPNPGGGVGGGVFMWALQSSPQPLYPPRRCNSRLFLPRQNQPKSLSVDSIIPGPPGAREEVQAFPNPPAGERDLAIRPPTPHLHPFPIPCQERGTCSVLLNVLRGPAASLGPFPDQEARSVGCQAPGGNSELCRQRRREVAVPGTLLLLGKENISSATHPG